MQQPFFRMANYVGVVILPRFKCPRAARRGCDFDDHFALMGKFYGVADEVYQDLTKASYVANEDLWYRVIDDIGEVQLFLGGLGGEKIQSFLDARMELKGMMFEFELA